MTDRILVLTPIKNASAFLPGYMAGLRKLTYPHEQISVALLEGDSDDGTSDAVLSLLPALQGEFRRVSSWKRDFGYRIPTGTPRWAPHIQLQRRAVLARSRNYLLSRALDDEDWVLWLDVDVVEYPADILQRLLETGKEIVQPHCVKEFGGPTFDCNAWRDHGRRHLDDMRGGEDLVKLDAVGGTMLLVRADIHREGLVFPTFPYGRHNPRIRARVQFPGPGRFLFAAAVNLVKGRFKDAVALGKGYLGEIETEGLGIMAGDMGYECWGMPHLEIRHADC